MSLSTDPDIAIFMRDLANSLDATPHGNRRDRVVDAADFLGVSVQTIYRRLKNVGWSSGRASRSDKGQAALDNEELRRLSDIATVSKRKTGKRLLSSERTLEIARANNLVKRNISPGRLNQLWKERGMSPEIADQASPSVQMATEHPNQVWQFDVSTCVLYYLKGSLAVMGEEEFYKNKPDNVVKVANQRVQRYLVTDHYTGAFFCRYYLAPGEDSQTLFRFLMEAFAEKEGFVMHGVPSAFVWDAGSANTSHMIANLLKALDVETMVHMPGNPRAKGQVECTHNIVECQFEGGLRFHDCQSIEQLNEFLDVWQVHFNSVKKHSRHRNSRWGLWQTIRQDQLRLAPPREICNELLVTKPQTRKVASDLTISFAAPGFKSNKYMVSALPGVYVGQQVEVSVNPYRAPSVWVSIEQYDGETYRIECEPLSFNAAGFRTDAPVFGQAHASAPDTQVEQARKQRDEEAFGTADEREASKKKHSGAPAYNGEIDAFSYLKDMPAPEFIRRRGTDLHVPNPSRPELKPLTHIQALKALQSVMGRNITPDENQRLRAWYPDGVPENELEDIAQRLKGRESGGRHLAAVS